MVAESSAPWLLLVPQLPSNPAYLRVKLWRRLREVGAVALKNAVHALPNRPECAEQFRALLREVEAHGGSGLLCEGSFPDPRSEKDVRAAFLSAREADYSALEKELRTLAQKHQRAKGRKPQLDLKLGKIRQRMAEIVALDFFNAKGRKAVETLLTQLEHSHIARKATAISSGLDLSSLKGRLWVTRQGIHVDRIACAWLIRRFIDHAAKFRFVADRAYRPRKGELRYDMPDGEFTHEGDQCSFETLLKVASPHDPALRTIAEIVHDLDLEDSKFGHVETPGIAHVINGICRTQVSDEARVARGTELFDDIYEQFRRAKQ
jgi:hypothetical protein